MPLSRPRSRELLHHRTVDCRGYEREDGLFDIEGHITDLKAYTYESQFRGVVGAGTPVHDMWIRVTIDTNMVIHAVEAVTDAAPYDQCPGVAANFQRLVGLSIKPGFLAKVRQHLGGVEGCTHLVELLGPLATTAFQTLTGTRRKAREAAEAEAGQPVENVEEGRRLVNSCHGFRSDAPQVKSYWPSLYTGK